MHETQICQQQFSYTLQIKNFYDSLFSRSQESDLYISKSDLKRQRETQVQVQVGSALHGHIRSTLMAEGQYDAPILEIRKRGAAAGFT